MYVGTDTVFLKSTGAINNNEASKGGGIYIYKTQSAYFSSIESEHKIILKGEINNNSGGGGGIYCRQGNMLFDSVTISGNTGDKKATAIYYGNSDSSDYGTSGGVLLLVGKTAIQGNIYLDNYRCWAGYICPSNYTEIYSYSSQMSAILLCVGWENNGQIGLSPLDSTNNVNGGFELNHVFWQDLNSDSQTITKAQVQNTFVDYQYGTMISIRTMTFTNGKCYIGKVKFQS